MLKKKERKNETLNRMILSRPWFINSACQMTYLLHHCNDKINKLDETLKYMLRVDVDIGEEEKKYPLFFSRERNALLLFFSTTDEIIYTPRISSFFFLYYELKKYTHYSTKFLFVSNSRHHQLNSTIDIIFIISFVQIHWHEFITCSNSCVRISRIDQTILCSIDSCC